MNSAESFRTPPWVIFDLDGTLANIGHRLKLIEGDKPDWAAFNMACWMDDPKSHIIELLRMAQNNGKCVAIFSGRMETAKERTIDWLAKMEIKYDILEMRKSKDFRSDTAVKKEMFEKHFKKEDIWFVADDRDKVVALWRGMGLTCLQVQKGDY